jgi:uncharacterized protein YegL
MVSIALITQIKDNYNCININPIENNEDRLPVSICLVIDNSGSMISNVSDNTGEKSNLSALDIVVHSAKTIIESLNHNDEISIIKYSTVATVIVPIKKMTNDNKLYAFNILDGLITEGTTNIYDGIKKAIELFNNNINEINNRYIYLLSDGNPNVEPPRGTYQQLLKDFEEKNNYPIINTFGFGYGVNSNVLRNIASINYGSYGFISDGNMVGTIITNNLANTLCVYYNNPVLSISLEKDTKFELINNYKYSIIDNTLNIFLNSLKIGCDRNIIIKTNKPFIDCKLYCLSNNKNIVINNTFNELNNDYMTLHIFRHKFIKLIDKLMISKESDALIEIDNISNEIDDYIKDKDNNIFISQLIELKKDIDGEVKYAVEFNAFKKWGEKYLPSLQDAHFNEYCNNFKDDGVQNYGGELFKKLQSEFENVFINLPAPIPTQIINSVSIATAVPVSMASFYDRGGTCFHGLCNVKMEDDSLKLVQNIKKGDIVFGGGIIKCVVRTKCKDNLMQYCRTPSGLLITKYHPIKYNNQIIFPHQEFPIDIYESDYMYSFLLEKNEDNRQEFIIINDIECITLAHNIINDDVAKHSFFGTDKIEEQLKLCNGWKDGLITFNASLELFNRNENDEVFEFNLAYEIY